MSVAIVVCSHNGVRLLDDVVARCLDALRDVPDGSLVLVDSASNDATGTAMEAWAARSDMVVAIREPRLGKALALNAALAHTGGRHVLFTDDDVFVPANWVTEMVAPLRAGYAVTTGSVHLRDELRDRLTPARCELLADTRFMRLGTDPPRTIVGASMGLSSAVVDAGVRFAPELGPGALGFMEETLLHMQVAAAGGRTAFVAAAPVLHDVDPSRAADSAMLRRAEQQGRCEAWVAHHWHRTAPNARDLLRDLAASHAHLLKRRMRRPALGAEDHDLLLVRRAAAARWTVVHRYSAPRYGPDAKPSA